LIARALALLAAAAAAPVLAQPAPGARAAAPAPADKAAGDVARMREAVKEVAARAESARLEKDVVKLNCVNERLTQMRAFLKLAEQAELARAEAVARKDPSAEGELAKVGVARTKVETLRVESEKCAGKVAFATEERTTVEVQQPQGLPEPGVEWGDGVRPDPAPPPVERPAPASQFQ
jgi:hypothetical protein